MPSRVSIRAPALGATPMLAAAEWAGRQIRWKEMDSNTLRRPPIDAKTRVRRRLSARERWIRTFGSA